MDFNLNIEIQEYLDSHERLIWTGEPKTGIVFRLTDLFIIPFSLVWCGFAIFWLVMAVSMGAPFFFSMFGVPFVVVGLYFVFGRFIVDAIQRKNTVYAITDSRIMIKTGVYTKSVQSFNIQTLADIQYYEKSDGSGTINIGPQNPMMRWGSGMNWWPSANSVGSSLDLIPDVRMVYEQIIDIQKRKSHTSMS